MLQSFRALIITGGSSGIGKSFIEHALTYNPRLAVFNISRSKAVVSAPAGRQLNLRQLNCDFAEPLQVSQLGLDLASLLERELPVGRILLINNSGYGTFGVFPEPNLQRNTSLIDVNVRAPVELTGHLLPLLKRNGGAIINVSSTAAFQATAGMATYGASKVFILHWSLALAQELRSSGIPVLALCPGPTRTAFFENADPGHGFRAGSLVQSPEEVVETAFRALARGKTLVVCGWKNRLRASLASMLPKPLVARLAAGVIARVHGPRERPSHG